MLGVEVERWRRGLVVGALLGCLGRRSVWWEKEHSRLLMDAKAQDDWLQRSGSLVGKALLVHYQYPMLQVKSG